MSWLDGIDPTIVHLTADAAEELVRWAWHKFTNNAPIDRATVDKIKAKVIEAMTETTLRETHAQGVALGIVISNIVHDAEDTLEAFKTKPSTVPVLNIELIPVDKIEPDPLPPVDDKFDPDGDK